MAEPDDLDSMLDDALGDLDVQEAVHQKEKEEVAAQLMREREAAAAAAMGSPGGMGAPGGMPEMEGATGNDLQMLQQLQALLGTLGTMNPEQDLSEAQVAEMQKTLKGAVDSLATDASTEEQAELSKCTDILQKLGDDAKPPTEEELATMAKRMEELQEQLQKEVPPPSATAGTTAGDTATGEGEKAAEELTPEEEEKAKEATEALSQIFNPEVLAASFKTIRDKYPPWLDENRDKLSEADRTKYEKQNVLIQELCSLLDSGALEKAAEGQADAPALGRFLSMVDELQGLGPPPEAITRE